MRAHSIGLALLALLLTGCCLESIKLKPTLTDLDYNAATAGELKADLEFFFRDCCPTDEQKALALRLQSKVADAFDDVVGRRITLEQYNSYVTAAKEAITHVVLVCVGQPSATTILRDPWEAVRAIAAQNP